MEVHRMEGPRREVVVGTEEAPAADSTEATGAREAE